MPKIDDYEKHQLVDGIEECNPPLHPLFKLFAITFLIWTIGYILLYPAIGAGWLGWSQYKDYDAEMAQAKRSGGGQAMTLAAALSDPGAIASGETLYSQNCQACHGLKGPGPVGPDLSDAIWIYGGKAEEIEKVILNGTAKGMPGWQKQLGEMKVRQLVAFVKSL